MKTSALILLLCWAAPRVSAAEPVWSTDIDKIVAQAKAEKKEMLLFFTGTGWSKNSLNAQTEIFSKDDFKAYASEKLILHLVDFPRQSRTNPVVQSKELQDMNIALRDHFKVKAYPTFILLNSEGYEIGRDIGYTAGKPNVNCANFMLRVRQWKCSYAPRTPLTAVLAKSQP